MLVSAFAVTFAFSMGVSRAKAIAALRCICGRAYVYIYMCVAKEICTRPLPHSHDPDQSPKHGVEVMASPNEAIGLKTTMSDWVYFLEALDAWCPQILLSIF